MNSLSEVLVYSDESRHGIGQAPFMVIGSIWGEKKTIQQLKDKVNLIKTQHDIPVHREIKWTKVSPAKDKYYQDIVKLFFNEEGLNFRAVVIPTTKLRHKDFQQTPDDFYYKMQFVMLSNIARKQKSAHFKIYLDYKDSWSSKRAIKLAEFLKNSHKFKDDSFNAQPIRSYESVAMQITDLLIGAIAYAVNNESSSNSKTQLVNLIEKLSGQKLNQKTPFGVDKFNIFIWEPQSE